MNWTLRTVDTAAYQRRDYTPLPDMEQVRQVRSTRTRVTGHRSPWNKSLESRLDELSQLEPGWDGYRARPVLHSAASFAAMMLEHLFIEDLIPPSLVPRSDGSLQVEWHKNQYDIELVVSGTQDVRAYRIDELTGNEEELDLENDFTQVVTWLKQLVRPRSEAAAR